MHHQHKLRDIRRTSAVARNAGQSSKSSGRAAVVVVDAAEDRLGGYLVGRSRAEVVVGGPVSLVRDPADALGGSSVVVVVDVLIDDLLQIAELVFDPEERWVRCDGSTQDLPCFDVHDDENVEALEAFSGAATGQEMA